MPVEQGLGHKASGTRLGLRPRAVSLELVKTSAIAALALLLFSIR